MGKIPFYNLEVIPQSRKTMYGSQKKVHTFRQNIGLDTETYLGKLKLIMDSFGNKLEIQMDPDGHFLEPDVDLKLLKYLNFYKYRNSFCWFWNIDYDFSGFLKCLERDKIRELYLNGNADYKGYQISYLPGKFFEIRKDKHHTCFYDMTNFIATSLDYAARTYLKTGKLKGVDGNELNTNLEYWEKHHDDIIKYCRRDAELTRDLADWFWNLVNQTLEMNPRRPYSKGAYSQEYFLSKCYVPRVQDIPDPVLFYAHSAYYGGRFEILQRGYFKEVYSYDIKSAYPSIMATLPDFSRGDWGHTDEYDPDADYGFYFCKVKSMSPIISPFMQKFFYLNCYCNGMFVTYLNACEIKFIQENFKDTEIEVIDGYSWIPNGKIMYPFAKEVERLYQWKEMEKDDNVRYVVKTFLNATAGKFYQCIGGRTGKLYNPLYASECTARTRLKLLEAANKCGFYHVIGFSTDAIHCSRPFTPDKTREDSMGDFVLDFSGEGVFIMSDIYTVWNDEKEKNRFRGKMIVLDETGPERKTKSIKAILEEMGEEKTEYEYICRRPVRLGEAVAREQIDSLNIFHDDKRSFNINGDEKRKWKKKFISAQEALETHHMSIPLKLGDRWT